MTLPAALRGLLLLLLAAAVAFAFAREPGELEGGLLRIGDETDLDELVRALSGTTPPSAVLRVAEAPPSLAEVELLLGAAAIAPLHLLLPPDRPSLVGSRPERLVQGRTGTIDFQLSGAPGGRIQVHLEGNEGGDDTREIVLDEDGSAEGFFRVRPARPGAYEWRIRAEPAAAGPYASPEASAPLTAWVRDAGPLRVLVVTGPPTWESRFLVRALEEEGVSVALHQAVAPGLAVTADVERPPLTVEELEPFDAVILLPGAPLGPRRLDAVEAYLVERGGGVLLAGAGENGAGGGRGGALDRLGLASGSRAAGEATGGALRWLLPPEIVPLPDEPVRFALRTFEGVLEGAVVGAHLGEEGSPALVLGVAGRGRVASLGIRESWRWRMEAGRVAEHREFWRTLAEWLAGGLREEGRVIPDRERVPAGATVTLRIEALEEAGFERAVIVSGPGGSTTLPVAADGSARFIPADTGVYALSLGDDGPRAVVRVDHGGGEDPTGRLRLARAAYASAPSGTAGAGGGVVDADSAARLSPALSAPGGLAARIERRLPVLLLLLLFLLGAAEWTLRRLRGMA